jgi:hypothetical protein
MLDLVVTSSGTGTFARAMDELQEFVYEVYKTIWHKDELATILRNSEHKSEFDEHEDFLWSSLFCV